MIAVSNLLDYALFAVLLPVRVQDRLGAPEVLGLILGASGVCALLGNLIGAWLGPASPAGRPTPSGSSSAAHRCSSHSGPAPPCGCP